MAQRHRGLHRRVVLAGGAWTASSRLRVSDTVDLLLRSDVHTFFDRGYLAIHPQRHTLMVSPRLRTEWSNGEEFYQRETAGHPITEPARRIDRPNREYLTWHADAIFKAS